MNTQSGPENNGNEVVFHISQSSKSGPTPTDGFVLREFVWFGCVVFYIISSIVVLCFISHQVLLCCVVFYITSSIVVLCCVLYHIKYCCVVLCFYIISSIVVLCCVLYHIKYCCVVLYHIKYCYNT